MKTAILTLALSISTPVMAMNEYLQIDNYNGDSVILVPIPEGDVLPYDAWDECYTMWDNKKTVESRVYVAKSSTDVGIIPTGSFFEMDGKMKEHLAFYRESSACS